MKTLLLLFLFPMLFQTAAGDSQATVVNSASAKWDSDAKDPASQWIVLRQEAKSGALELFVRYPAGHVFIPHWHNANERMVLLEGTMTIGKGDAAKTLQAGGYAFLPAKEPQYLACGAQSRCAFYVYWDSDSKSHPVQ
jgi:quercetin dioxygenase-like cupin family protein